MNTFIFSESNLYEDENEWKTGVIHCSYGLPPKETIETFYSFEDLKERYDALLPLADDANSALCTALGDRDIEEYSGTK